MNHETTKEDLTVVLNNWIINNDLQSANTLKSMIYYHLKGLVRNEISDRAKKSNKTNILEQLPNTTSFLHDILLELVPPVEMFENKEQFFVSLAMLVRWMLLDQLKYDGAQKRSAAIEKIDTFAQITASEPEFIAFDQAFSRLEKLSPRCYQVALLHYYLGHDVANIEASLNIKKSTAYKELAAAKAYLRAECEAA